MTLLSQEGGSQLVYYVWAPSLVRGASFEVLTPNVQIALLNREICYTSIFIKEDRAYFETQKKSTQIEAQARLEPRG